MASNKEGSAQGEANESDKAKPKVISAAKSSAACHTVLNTTELLEAIILCLPPIKSFGVRRVRTEWLDTILSSVLVKQHLFLSPITSGERRGLSSLPQSSHDEKHDTLELAIAPRGTTCGGGAIIGSQELFGFGFSPVELCPLLAPYSAPFDSAMKALHFKKDACDRLDVLDFVGHSGSQRGMYLTNSPCKESYLLPDLELKTHSRKIIKPATTLRDNWGITLGTLFDRLLNDVGEYIFLEEVNEEACSGSSTVSFDAMSLSHAITKWGIYRWERYRFISSEFR